ncbi:hypothetical protein [Haloferax sp. KTX1]|uniref:hypothetical protein n=1 Tax=Haloferax sp. KTX1 TaxID=2600597 RepID=UPI002103D956|nr:hypothetical protein [Haloferax sp. KTX1]
MVKRRSLLKGVGASIALSGISVVSSGQQEKGTKNKAPPGTGSVDNENRLPIYAKGKTKHKIKPDPDSKGKYIYKRTFKSPDLAERYGDPVFRFEPISVPEDQVKEEVRSGKKSTYIVKERNVIGTKEEQMNSEDKIHKAKGGGSHVLHVPDIEGNVPLYHYAKESDAENMQNRGAPLNVAWETEDSQSIKNHMENGDGGGRWLPGNIILAIHRESRYVNLPDGDTKSNDKHVMRFIPNPICTTRQYHVRLYDVPFDDIAAIGQAHRDPCDHGLIPYLDTNFKIDQARQAVVDFWEDGHSSIDHESTDVGNTSQDYNSHSGTWAYFDES